VILSSSAATAVVNQGNKRHPSLGSSSSTAKALYNKYGINIDVKVFRMVLVSVAGLNVYCLQFYVRLGPESPLDERQIMENRLSSGTETSLRFFIKMNNCSKLVWTRKYVVVYL
jgi:hypothetical protein